MKLSEILHEINVITYELEMAKSLTNSTNYEDVLRMTKNGMVEIERLNKLIEDGNFEADDIEYY